MHDGLKQVPTSNELVKISRQFYILCLNDEYFSNTVLINVVSLGVSIYSTVSTSRTLRTSSSVRTAGHRTCDSQVTGSSPG